MALCDVGGAGSNASTGSDGAVNADLFANCDYEDEGIGGKLALGFQIDKGMLQFSLNSTMYLKLNC